MAARLGLLSLLVWTLSACVQDDGKPFNPIADMTSVSEDEERELGLEFDQEIRKHVRVIEDPVVAGFINDLGQEIVQTIEPQPFLYRFRVIDDPSLNAFAVPGGYVYFHSGTLMAAGSIDELAGVMGHEIAHVKAHHYARMQAKSQIPDLLVGLAGMAAAIAAEEPGILVATQAANVAVKLRFSREFENEADQLGSVFMTRAGWKPAGITRFFQRILHEQRRMPDNIPPYLFSHPDVEDRIESVRIQAESLRPTRSPDARFAGELYEAQGRLAMLKDTNRDNLPSQAPPVRAERSDPLLDQARRFSDEGRLDEALVVLSRAEAIEPGDPRVPYRIGELLAAAGRHREAVAAFRRTVRLDPSRGLVFYKMGLSHKEMGERINAVYAFEQASRRAGDASSLRKRADWQIEILIFPILLESGLADGVEQEGGATPLGATREFFDADAQRVAWWARLSSRYGNYAKKIRVQWRDPAGRLVSESRVKRYDRPYIGALLELTETEEDGPVDGEWTVEARYEDDVLDRRSFRIQTSR